ncbi:MAG: hypothetical protein ABL901_19275 [Hyphomicrobiaceae bacterium]
MRVLLAAIAAMTTFGIPANAGDTGCTVVLCLLNPAGWADVAECVPPVQDFIRSVAWGGGAPNCSAGNGQMAISRGRRSSQRYIQYTDADGVRHTINF